MFKYKFDTENFLIKYKARLCVRDDLQSTEQDVYAATLAYKIFRAFITIVNVWNLETRQYDAINAFANSDINESTYCIFSEDWKESKVLLLLLKALYELKQASTLWYRHLTKILNELKLKQVSEIECLFVNAYMLIFFYVNDIAILYEKKHTQQMKKFQNKFFQIYEMRYIDELQWFLDIRITRDRNKHTLTLCQDSYIDKLIAKFNVNTSAKSSKASLSFYEQIEKNLNQATAQQILAY